MFHTFVVLVFYTEVIMPPPSYYAIIIPIGAEKKDLELRLEEANEQPLDKDAEKKMPVFPDAGDVRHPKTGGPASLYATRGRFLTYVTPLKGGVRHPEERGPTPWGCILRLFQVFFEKSEEKFSL